MPQSHKQNFSEDVITMVARSRSPGPYRAPRKWNLDPTTLAGRSGHALSQGRDGSRDVAENRHAADLASEKEASKAFQIKDARR